MSEPPSSVLEVVLDIGQRRIIAGFAGDSYPLTVPYRPQLLARVADSSSGLALLGLDDAALTCDERAQIVDNLLPENQQILKKYQSDVGVHWLAENDREQLLQWLTQVFCYEVMVTPRHCRVILLDSGFSMPMKTMIVSILLNSIGVKAVEWLPSPVMTAVASGVTEAIVLNFGWHHVSLTVVSDLRDVTPLLINRGEARISPSLTRLALHYHVWQSHPDESFDAIERMITAGEVDNTWDFSSVSDIITQTVAKLAIDTRPQVLANVMVMGEMVEVPGFVAALSDYITPRVPGLTPRGTLGSWRGASLYVSNVLSRYPRPMAITKETYARWAATG
ncbi:hypothetical protein DIURU_002282 [Diutina rugosa]|uniref:Actin-like protein n=1 Tax=Diutina rugosa TaxID=5481 RepID=A0A642UQY1_DIURU|nr:uncharacterized protein DIURU_002282 [Diutina rugosa]KAA8903770.1 hypothetical protein DIURU_002282 [Diutina rugosa]